MSTSVSLDSASSMPLNDCSSSCCSSCFESLSYAKLFPESLRQLRAYYRQVWPDADALRARLCASLDAELRAAPSLDGLLDDLSVTGRVKSVTSRSGRAQRQH